MKNIFYEFLENLGKIFFWPNFIWHILAIALTYFVVMTGIDWYYFDVTRGISFNWVWVPTAVLGSLLPLIIPFILYASGRVRKDFRILNTAYALVQTVIMGIFISSMYKVFTGRIPPDLYNVLIDISHGFRFGILEGGIFWGWPSSHTTIAFAMIFTLIILYPLNKLVKYLGLFYAFYIGFGASIGFHWISEVISGIIMGTLIGVTVGKSFQHRFLTES